MESPPTLRSLSKKLGVSPSTVGRALSNDPRISETQRKRIQKVADEAGYRQNAAAKLLVQQKTNQSSKPLVNLACLVGHKNMNPIHTLKEYQLAFEGAQDRAEKLGFNLDLIWIYEPDMSSSRIKKILESRGVSGIFLLGMNEKEIALDWESYASVYIMFGHSPIKEMSFPAVAVDPYETMCLALSKIPKYKLRRVGLVQWKSVEVNSSRRYQAALQVDPVFNEDSQLLPVHYIGGFKYGKAEAKIAFLNWFKEHQPELIITAYCAGVIEAWLKEIYINIPSDLGLVDLALTTSEKRLSGTALPHVDIGACAVDWLVGAISRNDFGRPLKSLDIILPPIWIEGKTL